MRRFLLGGISMAAVLVLASFAVNAPAPGKCQAVTPFLYQGMPLTRAFRQPLILTGPQSIQMPPTGGIVITQVIGYGQSPDVTIAVNGVGERFTVVNSGIEHVVDPNPPLIARPGDVLTFTPGFQSQTLVIAGYTTLPGET